MHLATKTVPVCLLGLILIDTIACRAHADSITLAPIKDNTLFESGPLAPLSNGAGAHLFAGKTAMGDIRRALLAFDIAAQIPAGSTISSATLTLYMSRTIVGDEEVTLHRLLADWGEGASDAPGPEGIGATAEAGDATWLCTFFPNDFWTTAGGDFVATASALTAVGFSGFYSWSDPAMAGDVQVWLDDPAGHFGWVLVGNEDAQPSAKRFESRENAMVERRPQLTVEFMPATTPVERRTWGAIKAVFGE